MDEIMKSEEQITEERGLAVNSELTAEEKRLAEIEDQIAKLIQEESIAVQTCATSSAEVRIVREKLSYNRGCRKRLEAERRKLQDSVLKGRDITVRQTPSRVDLMDAWYDLLGNMLVAACIFASITFKISGKPTYISIMGGVGLAVVAWLPGIVAAGLIGTLGRFLDKRHPLYRAPRKPINGSPKEIMACLDRLSGPASWARDISFGFCALAMIFNVASLWCEDFIYLSLVLGFIYSAVSLIIIATTLLIDAVSLFYQKCILWMINLHGLRRVF